MDCVAIGKEAYGNFDGTIAVDFVGDVEWPSAVLAYGTASLGMGFKFPYGPWIGGMLERFGDGGKGIRSKRRVGIALLAWWIEGVFGVLYRSNVHWGGHG